MQPRFDDVCRGRSPVAEPGRDALVEPAVAGGTLHASTSYLSALDGADISLVCVGTPATACGAADPFYIRRAVDDIVAAVKLVTPPSGHHSVIIRSTVPPGTVEEVVVPALTRGLASTEIAVGRRCAGVPPRGFRGSRLLRAPRS